MPLPYYGKSVCAAHRSLSSWGKSVCARIFWACRVQSTSALHIVLVHTQGSFVSKILTPHASPVGFYRLCQGFSQQWICKERKGGELPILKIFVKKRMMNYWYWRRERWITDSESIKSFLAAVDSHHRSSRVSFCYSPVPLQDDYLQYMIHNIICDYYVIYDIHNIILFISSPRRLPAITWYIILMNVIFAQCF